MSVTARMALWNLHHEAVVRQTYFDSANVATWSAGLTSATGHKVERYIGNPQSMQHCMDVYAWAFRRYQAQVIEAFAGHMLTEAQTAAAMSFHWNTGAIKRASWVRAWKAGHKITARKNLTEQYVSAGGKRNRGLIARRKAEAALMFDGVWSGDGTVIEYTRLTARSTPVWSSAVRVDVSAELARAFNMPVVPKIDVAPRPDIVPEVPTLTPKPSCFVFISDLLGGRNTRA